MKFETLFTELVDSTNMINTLLAGIDEDEARIKPTPETWSILEVVCHLYDEEREDFRQRLRFILGPRGEWHEIHPSAWVVERGYNTRKFRDMKEKFFGERNQSLDWLKGLEKADWDASYTYQYGTLTAGQMLASWVAHDNLHIRQLVELRRSHIERITAPLSIEYAGEW
jgi:hypothetical protein